MTDTKHRNIAEYPRQIVERVSAFIEAGDLDGVMTMFHPQCKCAMDPEQPPLDKAAVRQLFAEFMKQKVHLSATVSGELINGDTAILHGEWQMVDDQGTLVAGGTSTEVAKQLDHGGWVYFIDCPVGIPKPQTS